MIEIVKLQCPSCAGTLEVTKDLEQFACGYCGTAVIVRRGGGTISLSPVIEGLQRVERGVDRTASELAIKRIQEEVAAVDSHLQEQRRKQANDELLFAVGCIALVAGIVALIKGAPVGAFFALAGGMAAYFGHGQQKARTELVLDDRATIRDLEDELRRHRETVRSQ